MKEDLKTKLLVQRLLEQCSLKRALVIGDIMVDHYIWGRVSRISPEAPVPVVHVDKDTFVPGGAANVASCLAGLGASVKLLGAYGDDTYGCELSDMLNKHSIELMSEGLIPGGRTICKTRVIAQRQQICRIDREPMAGSSERGIHLSESVLAEAVMDRDIVLISDYAKGYIDEPLMRMIRSTRQSKVDHWLLTLDPKPKRELDLVGLDLLTPNWVESLELAGLTERMYSVADSREVCKRIYDKYQPKYLVVTLGENGMLLCQEGQVIGRIPTVAREVYDVSGAGDTVVATLSIALSCGMSLEDAAHVANAAAGVVVSHLGTSPITRELLQEV
jgi:D-glycero-beta-D-manno-heptose-7-phosphate kinase